MKFFSACLALAWAASFTSLPEKSKSSEFVNYQDNIQHLDALLNIIGTLADSFDRNAATLDELISSRLVLVFVKPLEGLTINLFKLGTLLSDLSPAWFDEICTALDFNRFDVTEMVRGYSPRQTGSKWKAASFGAFHFKSISGALLAQTHMPLYCHYLAEHPSEILSKTQLRQCLDTWMAKGKHESVRKVLRQKPWFTIFHHDFSQAYIGHELEYIKLVCESVVDNQLYWMSWVFIPTFFHVQHMQPLIELVRSKSWPHALEIRSDSQDQELKALIIALNKEIVERDPVLGDLYFDSENFMGKWALPKCLGLWSKVNNREILNLNSNYPVSLSTAFVVFWTYGNESILKNTLSVMKELVIEPHQHIQQQYYDWLVTPRPFNVQSKIAVLIKPFLKSLPAEWGRHWHLRPLYQEMDANPSDFWPTALLTAGTQWTKEQLKLVSLSEGELVSAVQSGQIVPNASLFACALSEKFQKLKLLIPDDVRLEINDKIQRVSFSLRSNNLSLFNKSRDDFRAKWLMEFNSNSSALAFSANYKLLGTILPGFSPMELLPLIKNSKIRNRIALMMHLLPKVDSYYGSVKVNKNSIFFRNWVMLHFPASEGQRVADLKLLELYFVLRLRRYYPGFDIFNRDETGNSMALGLLNDPESAPRGRWNGSWDLTFEPTNDGPVVEEVINEPSSTGEVSRKRGREDDGTDNSSNKRQKTDH